MHNVKQWIALTAVGILAILAAGWFLVVSPKRSEAADLRATAAQQVSSNEALKLKVAALKAQARELPKRQAELAAAAAKIPDNPALPTLIRSLTKAADDAGVELLSLAPGQPAPVVVAAAPAAAAPAATSAPAAANGAPAAAKPAAAAAVAPAPGLVQIPVSLNVSGGYFQVEAFLDRVESLTRAMKVTNVTMAPGAAAQATTKTKGTLTAALQTLIYMSAGTTAATPSQ